LATKEIDKMGELSEFEKEMLIKVGKGMLEYLKKKGL
jgi:hypothetical protein